MQLLDKLTCRLLLVAIGVSVGAATLSESLPDSAVAPGALNPSVTQATIATTICAAGWARTARPDMRTMKRRLRRAMGISADSLHGYVVDHVVPLELGGAALDPRNLWLEPLHPADGWGSHAKDRLEQTLSKLVCRGELPLAAAQDAIAHDWIAAYRRYVARR